MGCMKRNGRSAVSKTRGLARVSRAVDLDGGCEEIERSDILNNCGNDTINVQESTKLNKERGAILSYCSNRCISCGLRGMFNGMVKGMLRRVRSQGLRPTAREYRAKCM
jgi:hypothetical protein